MPIVNGRRQPGAVAAGHQRLVRTIVLDCVAGCLKVKDALWENAGIELESVLITTSDDPEVLGIEPLANRALQRTEGVRFRDNRGEEVSAYRWGIGRQPLLSLDNQGSELAFFDGLRWGRQPYLACPWRVRASMNPPLARTDHAHPLQGINCIYAPQGID